MADDIKTNVDLGAGVGGAFAGPVIHRGELNADGLLGLMRNADQHGGEPCPVLQAAIGDIGIRSPEAAETLTAAISDATDLHRVTPAIQTVAEQAGLRLVHQ